MREKHFAEVLVNALAVHFRKRYGDVFERQAHKLFRGISRSYERNKRRAYRNDRMPRALGETVAVAGRAGARIRGASGRDDNGVDAKLAAVGFDSGHDAVFDNERLNGRVDVIAAGVFRHSKHGIDDVDGFVADGKNAVTAFRLKRKSGGLNQFHQALRGQKIQRRIQKVGISRHAFRKSAYVAVIRKIAPALAGDHHLPARAGVFIDYRNGRSGVSRKVSADKSGGASADYHYAFH